MIKIPLAAIFMLGHSFSFANKTWKDEPIWPLVVDKKELKEFNQEKVKLGRRLFHEERLSHDNSISCASCHNLEAAGVDLNKTAIGIGGQKGPRNSPTVFNSSLNFRQFWDGRADPKADYGRFNITGKEADRFRFKVPSLRLAYYTAPYMHNGSIETIEAAIKTMGKHQLGRNLSKEDIAEIKEFIKSLAGREFAKK